MGLRTLAKMGAVACMAAALAGCAARTAPVDGAPVSSGPRSTDVNGYYEYRHEGMIYVLGSITSVEEFKKTGRAPATTKRGFSAQGQAVMFETDNTGLEHRLMGEYDKRHGMSR